MEHGGKIYARSKPGKGATFFVELPVTAEKINESAVVKEEAVRRSK
jgi:signal transduction histidine kinase